MSSPPKSVRSCLNRWLSPIIMLTAEAKETDRVAGLKLGAGDYVVKPFSPLELVAQVEAVLRRGRTGGSELGWPGDVVWTRWCRRTRSHPDQRQGESRS